MGHKLFDFVIGNPPYQEDTKNTSDKPVYNNFMDAAYGVANKVELITPARFLFNAGKTPKTWNKKILSDPHFSVLHYEQKSEAIFPNTDIKGGIAITYEDNTLKHKPIGIFTIFNELNSIIQKFSKINYSSLSEIVYAPESYKLTDKLYDDHPEVINLLSKGHAHDVTTNIFSKLPNIFTGTRPSDNHEYIRIYGLDHSKRTYRWVRKDYISDHQNLTKYKVFIPKSNGSGALGEVLSTPLIGTPLIGTPLIGHTQSFISIGAFNTEFEANALLKYIKGKFSRAMLGILKVTQDNKQATWEMVPLQDFTPNSDIDWSKSVHEIDLQLYRKYGLDEKEIAFIESHVKEMA